MRLLRDQLATRSDRHEQKGNFAVRVPGQKIGITVCVSLPLILICLSGALDAQPPAQKSESRRAEILDFRKSVSASEGKNQAPLKIADNSKTDHGAMGKHPGMMDSMRDHMGPYTPRELYPSLMYLPELSPEKELKIEQVALQRMDEGLRMISQARAALKEATEKNDLSRMQQTASEMQSGVARYESGLAALAALKGGQQPPEIALSWFRGQMNLDSSGDVEPRTMIMGMSLFHLMICSMMLLFAAVCVWIYFLRMRRVSVLIQSLEHSTFGSIGNPETVAPPVTSNLKSPDTVVNAPQASWTGNLRVASIFRETPNVKTFRLINPTDTEIPFPYLPGQFLLLKLEIDGKPVKRSYTIASAPTHRSYIEITVKHEPEGTVSRYLHEQVRVGDLLQVTAPAGNFTFTGAEHESIVLIGGGVGITPLMSVARALTDMSWQNEIYFLYSCQTSEEFIFREELAYLQERHPNFHLVVTLSREAEDHNGFHHGRISKALIANSVPQIAKRRVHVCGTPAMMKAVTEMLTELGVSKSQIKLEAFGSPAQKQSRANASTSDHENAAVVTFSRSKKSGPLASESTILEAAEAIGVEIDNACRSGLCGTCKVRLNSGTVSMEVEEGLLPGEKESGLILSCQARSDSNVDVEA